MGSASDNNQAGLRPNIDAMHHFISWWFRGCARGAVEIGWTDPHDPRKWTFRRFELEDEELFTVAAAVNALPGVNVYFRVSTIDPDAPSGKTLDEHVVQIPGVHADIDNAQQMEQAAKVVSLVRPLGWTITGKIPTPRVQPYLRFDEPLDGLDPRERERARALNARLARLYGSDRSVVNPSRLMRLPGTIAWPMKPGRVAEMTEWHRPPDRAESYPLYWIERQLPDTDPPLLTQPQANAAPAAQPTSSIARVLRLDELIAHIKAGDHWHMNVVQVVAHWVGRGWSDAEISMAAKDFTLPGYTHEQTLAEVGKAIEGARRKWNRPNPVTGFEPAEEPAGPPPPLDLFADLDAGSPTLRADHLPRGLWPFVTDTAERMGVDPTAVALCSLVACASVITDDWKVQPKRHDRTWLESARIWAAIVGDPSVLKSPVIRAATRPVDLLDAQARQRHKEDTRRLNELQAEAKRDGRKGIAGSNKGAAPTPKLDRYLVEGSTVEALTEILRDDDDAKMRAPARKVLVRADELTELVASLDRYSHGNSKGSADRGAYLRLWNGGRYIYDRVGRGNFAVPNWSACVLGGIQPDPIRRLANQHDDDGLLQRFLFCVSERQGMGQDRPADEAAMELYEAIFPRLTALRPRQALDGKIQHVVLHSDAHVHREAIDALAMTLAAFPDHSGRLKATFGKWPGYFARLCLTFHLIEVAAAGARGEQEPFREVIPPETALRAARFMRGIVLPHLMRAEAVMFSSIQTGHARWIAGHILAHKLDQLSIRDVTRAYRPLQAPETRATLDAVLSSLVAVSWLDPEAPEPGKPPSMWRVNPAVHTTFAARAEDEKLRRDQVREAIAKNAEIARRGE